MVQPSVYMCKLKDPFPSIRIMVKKKTQGIDYESCKCKEGGGSITENW